MKICVLLPFLLVLGCVHGAPVEQGGLEQSSCEHKSLKAAARIALKRINRERKEGYSFDLLRLSNVHRKMNGEADITFFLTMDVVETNCSVLIRDDSRTCEPRPVSDTPVYGQCKAVVYISKAQRLVRLYKYNCIVRPVPAAKVAEECPDCPTPIAKDDEMVKKTVSQALQKFNKEQGLANIFSLLHVNRATAGMAMMMYYNVEFTIHETTCQNRTATSEADKCPKMESQFAHTAFCKASLHQQPGDETDVKVDCELFEPETAGKKRKLHLLGGETGHAHNDTHAHAPDHGKPHAAAASSPSRTHDHIHDRTMGHFHRDSLVGMVRMLSPMEKPGVLPTDAVDEPEMEITLSIKPDPGVMEPLIENLPDTLSDNCPIPAPGDNLVEKVFAEDPYFKMEQ